MNINQTTTYNSTRPPNQNCSFTSRNKAIRDLGDIALLARREFPMISDTLILEKRPKAECGWKMYSYISGLVSEIRGYTVQERDLPKSVLKLMEAIKELKVGNCRESSYIAGVACNINGVKDAVVYELMCFNPKKKTIRDLGHSVVGVGFKRSKNKDFSDVCAPIYMPGDKGIVIDNWIGQTDYAKNINYKIHPFFEKNIHPNEIVCYTPNGYTNYLSDKDLLYIEKKYPGLSKSKKMGLIKSIKYLLLDKKRYAYDPLEYDFKESYRTNCILKNSMTRDELTQYLTLKARSRDFLTY